MAHAAAPKHGADLANKILQFISFLPVPTGPLQGERQKLHKFQESFVRAIYEPTDGNGKLLVRSATLSTARQNGKSLLLADLVLAHLLGPGRRLNGTLFSAANDRFQAAVVYQIVRAMVHMMPELSGRLMIAESTKRMMNPITNSVYHAISAEAVTKLGQGPDFIVYDELGAAKKRQLYDVLTSSQGSRVSPLMVNISTQAQARSHLFSEIIDYGLKVNRREVLDRSTVCHLYTAPLDCDLLDEQAWAAANPAMGAWRSKEEIATKAAQARAMPSAEPMFRNLYLNQRVEALAPAIAPAVWDSCNGLPDLSVLDSHSVWGGLDLSAKNDLSACVFVGVDDEDLLHVVPYFWLPEQGLREREIREGVPWGAWLQQGFLRVTPGPIVDYRYIARQLAEITSGMRLLQSVAFDRWNIQRFKQDLDAEGVSNIPLESAGQGYRDMNPCVIALEDALLAGRVRHGAHPILTMCAANAIVQRDPAGNRKFDKARASGRIDGIVALSMAIGIAKRETTMPSLQLL
jgi:phage terminase large subunit-like protein